MIYLREPTARYLSEFRHVQRGATWKSATLMCGGRAWAELMPRCYTDEDWSDVELEEFMSCRHNLAVNRQTRMLGKRLFYFLVLFPYSFVNVQYSGGVIYRSDY